MTTTSDTIILFETTHGAVHHTPSGYVFIDSRETPPRRIEANDIQEAWSLLWGQREDVDERGAEVKFIHPLFELMEHKFDKIELELTRQENRIKKLEALVKKLEAAVFVAA